MRILLLNPPFLPKFARSARWQEVTKGATMYYPIWLAYAAGVLEKEGHEVKLIDASAMHWNLNRVLRELNEFAPELAVLDTSTPSIFNDIAVAERIKSEYGCYSVLVGPHPSTLPEEVLSYNVDAVARGEYDYTIRDLASALEENGKLDGILGLSWKHDGKIVHNPDRPYITDLDSLPFVSDVYRRHLDITKYFYAICLHPMMQIFTSRGCPNKCSFCLWPQTFMGRRFRARSAGNVVDEIEFILNEIPEVREIFFEDDTFSVNKPRVMEICNQIVERKLDLVWSANARADIPFKVLKRMRDSGCRLLVIGYESGDERILRNIHKGLTLRQMRRFTRDCKRLGILIHACFIFGLPGETMETIEKTIRFAMELDTEVVQFQVAVPFPGTEFYEWCRVNGYLRTNDWKDWVDEHGVLRCVIDYPNLPGHLLDELADRATLRYYLRPKYLLNAIKLSVRNPQEFKRMFKAASSLFSYLIKK